MRDQMAASGGADRLVILWNTSFLAASGPTANHARPSTQAQVCVYVWHVGMIHVTRTCESSHAYK